jgi:hypothetical protein
MPLQRLHAALSVTLRVENYPLYEGAFLVDRQVDEVLQGIDGLALSVR